jgi:type III secretory pathway component EscV
MEAHHYGYLIAGGFFGIHCLLLAMLIYKSNVFPKVFGGLLLGASAGYLIETFGNFNVPGYEGFTALIVGVAAALGEVGLTFYMITKGTTSSYKNLKELPL